ncbi:AB hydrolase superfamily protein YdjP [Polystyrenella longa]|uniref:AB hydrolase superfamily protein YdjP n=1 Tax=Polystyrenella longa TaxID=2528007 RepID=A0A518CN02_9PLAN|nr:alpha/beta fold hydrolase [Polystyrenella longa]QDU80583.1 AB hydrolase superfamily protein YdjP [Polystyrenella longa]
MKKIQLDDCTINVIDEGEGKPILFVHGFPLDHRMWREQRTSFSSNYRVIIPDLRGFGKSGVTEGTVSMAQFADDLNKILTELKVYEPVVYCGLSMGGYIAWEFARRYPERLSGLIVCDSKALPDSDDTRQTRQHSATELRENGTDNVVFAMMPKMFGMTTRAENKKLVEEFRQMMLDANPEGMAAGQLGMADRADATTFLSDINVPTLLIGGEEDIISPVLEMQEISNKMPHAQFVEIPKAGHLAPLEKPVEVNDAIRKFIDQL